MQPNAWVAQHIQVHYEPVTPRWSVTGGRMDSVNVRATTTYGTKRRSFYDLLQSSLNMQPARVDDYVEEPDGKKRAVPNVKETRLAQDKQSRLRPRSGIGYLRTRTGGVGWPPTTMNTTITYAHVNMTAVS